MSIPVNCPQCGAINQVNESLAGRRVRCPQCDTAVHVPEWDMNEAPPPMPEAELAETQAIPAAAVEAVTVAAEAVPVEAVPVQAVAATVAASGSQAGASLAELDDEDDDDDNPLKRTPRDEDELDMTPMVDVTFLLLIFFMVTAAFSLQKSIEMPRQQTDAPSTTVVEEEEEDLEMTELQIDEFGSFLVLAPDWEQETPGKQNLITTLKRAIEGSSGMRLVIKVHEQTKLQYLVDGMDAGTIAGFAETQVTQVEEFD